MEQLRSSTWTTCAGLAHGNVDDPDPRRELLGDERVEVRVEQDDGHTRQLQLAAVVQMQNVPSVTFLRWRIAFQLDTLD